MTSQADWSVGNLATDSHPTERLFFNEHEWATVEAATARIIPTDDDPGARDAGVVRFIDRYLSGVNYIFAAADGSGFVKLEGEHAEAWSRRIAIMQKTYKQGIQTLDALSNERYRAPFRQLEPDQQDHVLERVAGSQKPERVRLNRSDVAHTQGGAGVAKITAPSPLGAFGASSDDGIDFFHMLALHTRQGFYSDPVYGGNRDGIGWKVIGFPGPKSLADTNNLTYSVKEYMVLDYDWSSLIPYLREKK